MFKYTVSFGEVKLNVSVYYYLDALKGNTLGRSASFSKEYRFLEYKKSR